MKTMSSNDAALAARLDQRRRDIADRVRALDATDRSYVLWYLSARSDATDALEAALTALANKAATS